MGKRARLHLTVMGLVVMLSLTACGRAGPADTPEEGSGQTHEQPEAAEETETTEGLPATEDKEGSEGEGESEQGSQKAEQDEARPMVVRAGDTVRMHRVGILENGEVFDSYQGNRYLQFTVGEGEFLPAFEEEILGMEVGETKTFTIPAEDAYGPHYDALVFTIDRSELPEDKELKPGQMLQVGDKESLLMRALVVNVTASNVTLDANHLLAGEDLTFKVELVKIVS